MADLHIELDRSASGLAGQVAGELRAGIRSGRLARGTRLPSSRELARDLGVSRGVVVTAYEQLIAEGFLVSRTGDGTRVAALPAAAPPTTTGATRAADLPATAAAPTAPAATGATRAAGAPAADRASAASGVAYDLRSGADLTAFPRARWLAAVRHALRTMPNSALDYPDPGGVPELRAALAEYLGRVRAAAVTPDCVVATQGVAQGLALTIRALVAGGRSVLAVENPTSDRQLPLLRATGARLVRVPVDEEGIDVQALAATQARVALVTPAHQYPTGVVLSPRRRAELLAWARAVDGVVVEDDYDAEFRYDRDPVGCIQGVDPERVVLAGSVSKSLAPALRLGWLAAPWWLVPRIRDLRVETDLGSPVIEQYALVQLIASGAYDRQLRVMRRTYRTRRDALTSALDKHLPSSRVLGRCSAGVHMYLELPPGRPESDVVAGAARLGVAVNGAESTWEGASPAPALILGYARLVPNRLGEAAELLGVAALGD